MFKKCKKELNSGIRKEQLSEYNHQYYLGNIERCKANRKRYYEANRERICLTESLRRKIACHKLKEEVLTYYGSGKLACIKCGFSDIRALSIDHLNGNGAKHRKEVASEGGGSNFYAWLKKQDFPEGYQTLCMNCQWIKGSTNEEVY